MILFTADWHIKLGQKNVPREWAWNRYTEFFRQVHEVELSCDSHIIGGDLFDRLPTMEELQLYFMFVAGVSIPTIIFDGNHEATKKHNTFFTYLKDATTKINPLVEIIDSTKVMENFSILPYCDLHKKNAIGGLPHDKALFTHVRGAIPPHVKPEIDLELLQGFPIVFAGDLHAHSNSQENIVYPGSPMTTSFHRSIVETGYILISSDATIWSWHQFELPQLLRMTVDKEEDMVATPYHHTVYELEGDLQGLSEVKNSDLLDKKVVKRSIDTALLLTSDMDISDELVEYFRYILELPEDNITNIMGTFHDYT